MKKILALLSFLLFILNAQAQPWQTLQPGLSYRSQALGWTQYSGAIHAFKINLDYFDLDFAFASELHQNTSYVKSLAKTHQAIIAINGGFFTPQEQVLGLRIKNHQTVSSMKDISWWGVFYTKHHQAFLTSTKQFRSDKIIDFAVQAGPRLIVNNRIMPLKDGVAERTALGITQQGEVILLVTYRAPMTTTALAEIMAKSDADGGFNCRYAINLDGGNSTQLYADVAHVKLNIRNLSQVTDAILVKPRD